MKVEKKDYNNDEIDLFELIVAIWGKRWWVVLCVIIFVTGSLLYAFNAKENWKSEAELIMPNIKEMGNYLDFYERYDAIVDKDSDHAKNQEEIVSELLFNAFSSAIGSYEKQIAYLRQSDFVKEKNTDSSKEYTVILDLIQSIETKKPTGTDKNKNIDFVSVSFSAENANDAQILLSNFITYVNDTVREAMLVELKTKVTTKIRTLKIQKNSIKQFSDVAQSVRLENLKKALQIAKKAGVYEYSLANRKGEISFANLSGEAAIELKDNKLAEDNFLFLLGEKYLSAQVDILTNSSVVYPASYYQTELKINLLSELLEAQQKFEFDTFHYQSSPSLPLKRDAPKRFLIVLGGAFLGVVFGIIVALFMVALENRRVSSEASLK